MQAAYWKSALSCGVRGGGFVAARPVAGTAASAAAAIHCAVERIVIPPSVAETRQRRLAPARAAPAPARTAAPAAAAEEAAAGRAARAAVRDRRGGVPRLRLRP